MNNTPQNESLSEFRRRRSDEALTRMEARDLHPDAAEVRRRIRSGAEVGLNARPCPIDRESLWVALVCFAAGVALALLAVALA